MAEEQAPVVRRQLAEPVLLVSHAEADPVRGVVVQEGRGLGDPRAEVVEGDVLFSDPSGQSIVTVRRAGARGSGQTVAGSVRVGAIGGGGSGRGASQPVRVQLSPDSMAQATTFFVIPPGAGAAALFMSRGANGAIVARRSTVTITATASDNVGVTSVEFRINGALQCTDTTAPYSCSWRVPRTANQTYQIQASARDQAGNVGSASVTVTAP